MTNLSKNTGLYPSLKLKTCEMHTCGEPLRIITNIEPPINFPDKSTILEKINYFATKYDHIRTMVMLEPRGHKDMFGAMLTDPDNNGDSDFGVIFFNNSECVSMCGHAIIGLGRYVLESKLVKLVIPETEITFDCPCGKIKTVVEWDGKTVGNTKFCSVPAFLQQSNYEIFVPELKINVQCDIAFGGNLFGIVSDKNLGVHFGHDSLSKIVETATFLYKALIKHNFFAHSEDKQLRYIYAILVTDTYTDNDISKTLCVCAKNSYDRSPCGSGSTALIANEYFNGKIQLKQERITENSCLGEKSRFRCKPLEEKLVTIQNEEKKAIIVQISGRANFIGESLFTFEEDDDLKFGFLL